MNWFKTGTQKDYRSMHFLNQDLWEMKMHPETHIVIQKLMWIGFLSMLYLRS